MLNVKNIIEAQLKARGFDKYVTDVTVYHPGDTVTTKYRVTVANEDDDVLIGFNVVKPYDSAVDVALKLGSLKLG